MKILIVNESDSRGGAARAASRLHKSLLDQNIDSQMLVQNKESDNYTITGPVTKIQRAINKMRPTLDELPVSLYKHRTKTIFSPSWLPFSNIVNKINEIDPDIVHLHWVCGGMIKIEDIVHIKAPVVWSLHDNWAFTGGCHIMWECEKYQDTCGACPRLGSSKENDLSRKVFNRKQKSFLQIENMTIVGLSKWLNACSKNSTLLKDKKHINLPNPIDTTIFKPCDQEKARELWNLPKDKKLVLFGAMTPNDINKGFNELSDALHKIKSEEVELVVFGSSEPKESQKLGFKTHYLGYLHDDVSLVTLYSAVDVMIVPSLQEAFGQTASEAMACCTPVVAFSATGLLDIVDHQINGYLAKLLDSADLAYGIDWILENKSYDSLAKNAREKVVKSFDSAVVAQKYIALYKDVLNGQ